MNAREWSSRIAELARCEHSALADLLLAVAEFDSGAVYRQVGARMIHRFPEIEEPVRDGRLCITVVSELAKVMTEGNRAEMLPRFFGCSRE
jgi:hypothetical protein